MRFAESDEKTWYSAITDQIKGWYQKLFGAGKKEEAAPVPRPAPRRPALPETDNDALPPASASAAIADGGMALDPGEVVEATPPSSSASAPAAPAASSISASAPPVPAVSPVPPVAPSVAGEPAQSPQPDTAPATTH